MSTTWRDDNGLARRCLKSLLLAAAVALGGWREARAEALATRFSLDAYLGFEAQDPLDASLFNPGNRVFWYPRYFAFTDLRPSAQLDVYDKVSLVARPRGHFYLRANPDLTPPEIVDPAVFDGFVNEAFVVLRPLEEAQVTVGRQNFQWGPAESFSPSNFFFPEILVRIEPFYEVRGRYMARANVSLGGQWSWITMAELDPVDDDKFETPPESEERSQRRLLTKLEYNWDSGGKYLGLVGGTREAGGGTQPAWGGYASLTFSDAWQFYGDMLVVRGTDIAYPVDGSQLSSSELDDQNYFVGVSGVRYTFPDGTELRLEGILNELGYDEGQRENLKAGLRDPLARAAFLQASLQTQTILPGQNFVYAALRSSSQGSWGPLRQPTASLRSLVSLEDGSSLTFSSLEAGVSDQTTLYLFGGVVAGAEDSVLRRLLNYVVGTAYRMAF